MKISRPCLSVLHVENNNLFIKFIGFVFFIVGLIFLFFMSSTHQLHCQHDASLCTLTKKNWFIKKELALHDVKAAKISNRTGNKGGNNYYLKLKTSPTSVTLNSLGSPTKKPLQKWKKIINQYLRNPQGSLNIGLLYPLWFFLLPALFLIVSSIIMIAPKKVLVMLDSNANKITFRRKSLLSQQEQSYALSALREITLQERRGQNGTVYRITFILKDGQEIPFSNSYDNLLSGKLKAIREMSSFLNLPMPKELEKRQEKTKKLALIFFFLGLTIIAASIIFMQFR